MEQVMRWMRLSRRPAPGHTEQIAGSFRQRWKWALLLFLLLTVATALLFVLPGLTEANTAFFLPRRLKKVGAILITAYSIGYSSVTFQTITNNKILTPAVMGLDSLYLFIQTVIVFFFGSRELSMMTGPLHFSLSVGFMIGVSLLLFLTLFRREGNSVYFLILAGMVIGSLFNGLATFMQVLLDPNEFLVLQGKMFASFNNVNDSLLLISALLLLAVMVVTARDYRQLDAMSLGQDQAVSLGVPYNRMVLKTLIVTAVLISVSTALTGPVTFLGILVASLSREMLRTYRHLPRVWGAVLIGGFALLLGQLLLERVFNFNTTISVVINFVGGVYFIYLMLKEGKRA